MMSSMVEAVARAIYVAECEAYGPGFTWEARKDKEPWLIAARAAIAAMREPSAAVKQAGASYMLDGPGIGGGIRWPDHAERVWTAMLDAALSETGRQGLNWADEARNFSPPSAPPPPPPTAIAPARARRSP